jgi:hypothetical protein
MYALRHMFKEQFSIFNLNSFQKSAPAVKFLDLESEARARVKESNESSKSSE